MTGQMKKVYQKFAKSEAEATSRTLKCEESIMFTSSDPRGQFTLKISRHNNMRLKNVPHLEWNRERFQKSSPELLPSVAAEITMMPGIHAIFGRVPRKPVSQRAHPVLAFADTGTQTCSVGTEIQKLLGYPDGYLVSTNHRIQGITNDQLCIIDVFFYV